MASVNMKGEPVGWGFWLQWLLLMMVFISLAYTGIDMVERPILTKFVSDHWVREAFMVLGLALLGAVAGTGQWLLLRRHLRRASQWGWAMALTFVVGASLAELASFSGVALIPSFALSFLLLGPVCGIFQWLTLRSQVPRAGWWVLAQAASWLVLFIVSGVVGYGAAIYLGGTVDDYLAVSYAVGGAALGAMTGAVLVWMLREEVSHAR
jgi:hypothetical protein